MPDHRKHRGPHPQDQDLFASSQWPALRTATHDLSWLMTRGYAPTSAVKLVGDRYALDARQRLAVARCACSDASLARRREHETLMTERNEPELWIDGYNVLTSIEAALSGGVILLARDGCCRDMASMHGSYRKVQETIPAIHLLGDVLADCQISSCRWLFDQPVSNSGRLRMMLLNVAEQRGWNWSAELVRDPDAVLSDADQVVATSDSQILDRASTWFNLARLVIGARVSQAWIVDLARWDSEV